MVEAKTGTRNTTYDLVSVLYHALHGAETCEKYKRDASDSEELQSFFSEAQDQQRQIADRAKEMLRQQWR